MLPATHEPAPTIRNFQLQMATLLRLRNPGLADDLMKGKSSKAPKLADMCRLKPWNGLPRWAVMGSASGGLGRRTQTSVGWWDSVLTH